MKVGNLVKLLVPDVRGRNGYFPGTAHIPVGTMGVVTRVGDHDFQAYVKLFGNGGNRIFLTRDLEIVSEAR